MTSAYNLPDALLGRGEENMRKRGEQEGSIRQIGNRFYGRFRKWQYNIDTGANEWKQCEVRLDAMSERAAWKELREKHLADANAEASVRGGNLTLAQFVEKRFKPDHIAALRKGGQIHYASQLRHILPSLGGMKLRDITPTLVQMLVSGKASEGLSTQTVKHIRNALSAIFRYARDLELIDGRLPTEAVRLPRGESEKPQALTTQQARMILAAIEPRYRALVHFMLATGARASEAAGLRWADVNLSETPAIVGGEVRHGYTIHFRHAWRFGEYTELKSDLSRRDVPMTSDLYVALQMIAESSKFTAPADPVFTLKGKPIDMHNFLMRTFKPCVVKLGITWANLHSLRHTMSTWLDAAGAPMGQRSRLLGHGDTATTMRYTHAEMETARAAMEKASFEKGPIN